MITPGAQRLNPTKNKDYFKLRAVNGPSSKIPGVDAGSFGSWKPKGGVIQSPYDDYDLNYKYWEDDKWNTDNSQGLTDLWEYSAEHNPQFKELKKEEIESMDQVFEDFQPDHLYQNKIEEVPANIFGHLESGSVDLGLEDDPYKKPKKKLKLRSDDFEPNLGKVIDTLNSDYPLLFIKSLDYSIYIKDIEVTDPTGIAFQGINIYKNLFTALRFFAKTIFKSQTLTYKINYDYMEQVVRIIWHVQITSDFGVFQSPLFVDGISKYHINWEGHVYRHEVTNIVVNGIPQEPPYVRFFDLSWLVDG